MATAYKTTKFKLEPASSSSLKLGLCSLEPGANLRAKFQGSYCLSHLLEADPDYVVAAAVWLLMRQEDFFRGGRCSTQPRPASTEAEAASVGVEASSWASASRTP